MSDTALLLDLAMAVEDKVSLTIVDAKALLSIPDMACVSVSDIIVTFVSPFRTACQFLTHAMQMGLDLRAQTRGSVCVEAYCRREGCERAQT